jgi:hypothetical protein
MVTIATTLTSPITSPIDTPVLLIAAIVIVVLLAFAIIRKITKLIVITIGLGVIVVGLYIARTEGYITW